MRTLIVLTMAASVVGCTRWSMDHHLNNAYRAYDRGDCSRVMLELSQVDRTSRSRPFIHPEVSLLRGQCLERQKLYVDAAQTYQFMLQQYPRNEYSYRAQARLQTLEKLGHLRGNEAAVANPVNATPWR
ncbi:MULTISPECIES: tetratricopeptide repeat protein [Pseudomonas]|uniref:Tetratricopeptide repeat protein n=1 Tax=Pseudomonas farsensis TaxID=2745492 RepID=A0ABU8QP41_9PSED|nr:MULTISPECIES: tetratricopeptide repeat protein [Pseudomonas]MBC3412208.1 tetratricopeptide repeat protein [Pseudomonas sp. SWRI51]MBV4530248.1 tetratricopeptide repeat protein [Pseudomonas farsensis]